MNDIAKKLILIGPGGMNCRCCAPSPGSPERKKVLRVARRKADHFLLEEGLEDHYERLEALREETFQAETAPE